jgi:hypothetical protein
MSVKRLVAALFAVMLGATVISILASALPASADEAPSDSAVTVSGSGEFADLKVTVSQTKGLINQIVHVSWTGGAPTPLTGGLRNFLQIMQCWGDGPEAPDRTQCQFGVSGRGGVGRRVLQLQSPLGGLVDPAETIKPADPTFTQFSKVPFWPVGGERPTEATLSDGNDFFDQQSTNEVPVARTRADGTGEVDFEIQTGRQASGLGCGEPIEVNGSTSGRSCWLVIVPRGAKEVDDSSVDVVRGLQSSVLSLTNWKEKITIPLEFLPQGLPCLLGAAEWPITGHELVVDAVGRWQPALCANGGALFSYTQLNDDATRSQLLGSTDPGLAVIAHPLARDLGRADRPLVYAPVAVSGLTFAFRIVKNPTNLPPGDPKTAEAGQPFTDMKLTPRLVAKLLTQSYQGDVVRKSIGAPPNEPSHPPGIPPTNPEGLTNDPEFLKLNPEY